MNHLLWNQLQSLPARFPDVRLWPILLKNSVFEDDENFLARQANYICLDTRGHRNQLKVRHGASGAVTDRNSIGFSKWSTISRKLALLRFGVFQQNRPIVDVQQTG